MLNVSRSPLKSQLRLKQLFLRLLCASILIIFLLPLLVSRSTVTHANVQSARVQPEDSTENYPSQRNANYSIDVELDPENRTLTGREVLTWRNISSISTTELQFHLYYNAWKNSRSTWLQENNIAPRRGRDGLASRPSSDWGWIDVTAVRFLGEGDAPTIDLTADIAHISPDDGNPNDETVLRVPLPFAVDPGSTVNVEIEWTSRIPRTFARTGTVGDYFFIAQWFPKIGVLEESGWNCHQFHAITEFFSDYGVYDVRITAPTDWVVGATGLEREKSKNVNGTTTHHYYQEDVHDFAWTTSPDFIERRSRFEHPSLPDVDIRLLLQPEHAGQAERHFQATQDTLRYYGEWFGAYPYSHVTVVDPAWQSGSGGMEYPTFFTAGTRWLAPKTSADDGPEAVTIHEAGHQFWYGVIGNNEFEHAWLDEGLNTFATGRVVDLTFSPHYLRTRFFGGLIPWTFKDLSWSREIYRLPSYRRNALTDPPVTPSYLYWPSSGRSNIYDKPALWLFTLERYLGWDVLQKGMADFYKRWQYDHPKPDDFFSAINKASDENLQWFFDQIHNTSVVFDYELQQLTSRKIVNRGFFEDSGENSFIDGEPEDLFTTTVVIRRRGEGVFPVKIVTTFTDGHEERELWDGHDRWTSFTYKRNAKALDASVDPERVLLLDINYTNNSRTLTPKAAEAARKWSLKWLVWLQDLLLTYGFFV